MRPSLLVAAAAAAAAVADAALVGRTNLTDTAARCMDGTLSAFYYQPATTQRGTTHWVIYLQGGGECTTKTACDGALNGPLGSSNYFPSQVDMDGATYADDDPKANPDWFDAAHVNVPYCSQDLHSGMVTSPSPSTYGLYFSGHLIFRAVIDALVKTTNISLATDIVLTGASAGGIGVWINVDYVKSRFPAARVTAAPIAGFYFDAFPYTGVNHTSSDLADFRPAAWPVTYALWNAFADESCVAAMPSTPWVCMLSNYSYPFIESESFVVEAQTDQVVLLDHDWVPSQYVMLPPEQAYLAEWHANMTVALAPLMDPTNKRAGVFNPACFIHTDFFSTAPLLNGMNYFQAFGNWYFQRTGPEGYKLQDNCGIMCNPTCPK